MRVATGSRSILTSSARFLRRAFPFSGEDKGEKNSQICSNKAGFSVWMCECAKVRFELLRIHRLKSRSELTNEASPDQETFSEGSEDNLDLQDEAEWSDELEEN